MLGTGEFMTLLNKDANPLKFPSHEGMEVPGAKTPQSCETAEIGDSSGLAPKNDAAEGKPKPELIPMDILIEFLCPAYEEGIIKYEQESWRRGFYVSKMYNAAVRHLDKFFKEGEWWDADAAKLGIKKIHIAGAIFSLIAILHTMKYHPELDDRRDPATGELLKKKP
jgi:hypothetical protein